MSGKEARSLAGSRSEFDVWVGKYQASTRLDTKYFTQLV